MALLAGGWAPASVTGAAQEPASVGPALVVVASDPAAVGFIPRVRWRLAQEIGMTAGAGLVRRSGGALAGRGELTAQLRFGSWFGPKPAWYVSAGVAGVTGSSGGAFLMAGAGVELPTGQTGSWWSEVGVAGGFRVAVGYQFRYSALGTRRSSAECRVPST